MASYSDISFATLHVHVVTLYIYKFITLFIGEVSKGTFLTETRGTAYTETKNNSFHKTRIQNDSRSDTGSIISLTECHHKLQAFYDRINDVRVCRKDAANKSFQGVLGTLKE